jgi:Ni,Fe-hydrogenase maturation factor
MNKVLIIGYGNPDREDDGVAWHILQGVAERLGRTTLHVETGGLDQLGQSPDLLFPSLLDIKPPRSRTI